MVASTTRGWDIIFINNKWVYTDNLESIQKERACKKCGRFPMPKGYDACLGYLVGYTSVCCGHGIENPIRIKES